MHHRFADFLLIILLILLLLLITFASPLGTKAVVLLVNTTLPMINIEGESGTLLQDFHLDKLTIKNKKVHLEFIDLNIDWSEIIYKNNKINIKQLSGKTLTIYLVTKKKKKKGKTIIPTIPIPIDFIADSVKLADLNIINSDQQLVFHVKNMEIKNVSVINNLLTASAAKATLMIKKSPMLVHLKQAQLDFNQPHDMKGHGGIHYTNRQTGTFDGKVNVSGTLTDYELEGQLAWDELILGHSDVQIKCKGDYRKADIEQLIINNESALLNTHGKISWKDQFKWKFSVHSDKVSTHKYRPDWPAEFALELKAEGRYHYKNQAWSLFLDTNKLDGTLFNYPLHASGKIIIKDSFDLFLVEKIDLNSGDNRLKIDGKITEPMRLKWNIKATKLKQILPNVKGSIVGKGIVTGSTINPSGEGNLLIKNLVSKGITVGFADVNLKAGEDGLLRSGKVTSHIKKLAYKDFFVESVDVDFKGKEKKSLLFGQGKIKIKTLHSKTLALGSAHVKFNGTSKKIDLDGMINNLTIAGKKINSTKITAKGMLSKHHIILNGHSSKGNVYLQADGGVKGSIWKGKVSQLRLNNTAAGHWQLKKPITLQIADNRFSGSEICLNNPKRGLLCSLIKWNKTSGIQAEGSIKRVPLAQLKPWLPQPIDFVGFVNGRYDLQQKKGKGFYGQAIFSLPKGLIRYKAAAGLEKISYRNGKILFNFDGKTVTSSAEVRFDQRGVLKANATVNLSSSIQKHKIKAKAHFNTMRLEWFNNYLPDIDKLKGELSSTIKVHGMLTKPIISAELLLKKGQIKLPDTGTYLSNIQLQINSGERNKARINGSLFAGKNKLTMSGWFDYSRRKAWIANIKLKGKNLHFINTHEVQAYVSPTLDIKVTPKEVAVLGRLHIPRATITLDEIPETAIYESDDVVFTENKNRKKQKKKLRIVPNINISLGNNIQFNGFGLKGKLRGNFNMADNLNSILARGTLSVVDGEYRAYGQVLTIEQGMLIFNGPVGNPGLNIRATRKVEDLKVGLNLAGTLQKPKSAIFSNPTLPEDEALSYLLTGQSLTDSDDANTQLLLQAIRSLGLSSGGNLLNRIGGSIGLDDVNVLTFEDYKKNKIQLGKRFGSDLYVRYITGLFDAFHKIAIDYRMSKHWSLQAESGDEQAIDFIYEFR